MKIQFGERTIDPTIDYPFKRILGDPAHSHLTRHFLNGLMRQLGRPQFVSVEILNPFRLSEFAGDKDIVLDIHALADDHTEVQIEMQIRRSSELPLRMLDNWTRLYSRQLKKGASYQSHRPLYAIWLVNERFGDRPVWLRLFELKDGHGAKLSDHQNVVLIDLAAWRQSLPKAPLESRIDPEIAAWLQLLGSKARLDADDSALRPLLQIPELQEAFDIMKTLSKSDQDWYLHEARRKAAMDRQAWANDARKEGKLEGRLEGKLEDAAAFKRMGVSVETICAATGLPREQVEAL